MNLDRQEQQEIRKAAYEFDRMAKRINRHLKLKDLKCFQA